MKVYVVTMDWNYATSVYGVFLSEEKANEAIKIEMQHPIVLGSSRFFDIEEMQVNEE